MDPLPTDPHNPNPASSDPVYTPVESNTSPIIAPFPNSEPGLPVAPVASASTNPSLDGPLSSTPNLTMPAASPAPFVPPTPSAPPIMPLAHPTQDEPVVPVSPNPVPSGPAMSTQSMSQSPTMPVMAELASRPAMPVTEPVTVPTTEAPTIEVEAKPVDKKASLVSTLAMVGVFILLFGLAMAIGYFLGARQG